MAHLPRCLGLKSVGERVGGAGEGRWELPGDTSKESSRQRCLLREAWSGPHHVGRFHVWNSTHYTSEAPTVHTAGGHGPPGAGRDGLPILPRGPNFPSKQGPQYLTSHVCPTHPSATFRGPSTSTRWPQTLAHVST